MMSESQSKSSRSQGTIGGDTVDYEYSALEKKLVYQGHGNDSSSIIDANNIICCIGRGEGISDLLFVEALPREVGAVPVLKVATASRLPQPFAEAYSISPLWQSIVDGSRPDPVIDVILSKQSGTGLAVTLRDLVTGVLDQLNHRRPLQYSVHYTQSAKTVSELTESSFLPRAKQGIQQLVLLGSGDGGVCDIINALASSAHAEGFVRPILALLPVGTGNALAHSTGITNDNTLGLSTLMRGRPRTMPMFQAKFSPEARWLVNEGREEEHLPIHSDHSGDNAMYGAVVCSWAFHAALVADSDTAEYRKFGAERFLMAAKENLHPADGSQPHRYRAEVSVLRTAGDGEIWGPLQRQEHAYVLATLVSNLEKGFVISPKSKPLEGKMSLVHFGPKKVDELMRIMDLAYKNGQHVGEDGVGYEENVEGFRIDFRGLEEGARWRRICIDGNIIRVEKGGWVEARKVSLRALCILHLGS